MDSEQALQAHTLEHGSDPWVEESGMYDFASSMEQNVDLETIFNLPPAMVGLQATAAITRQYVSAEGRRASDMSSHFEQGSMVTSVWPDGADRNVDQGPSQSPASALAEQPASVFGEQAPCSASIKQRNTLVPTGIVQHAGTKRLCHTWNVICVCSQVMSGVNSSKAYPGISRDTVVVLHEQCYISRKAEGVAYVCQATTCKLSPHLTFSLARPQIRPPNYQADTLCCKSFSLKMYSDIHPNSVTSYSQLSADLSISHHVNYTTNFSTSMELDRPITNHAIDELPTIMPNTINYSSPLTQTPLIGHTTDTTRMVDITCTCGAHMSDVLDCINRTSSQKDKSASKTILHGECSDKLESLGLLDEDQSYACWVCPNAHVFQGKPIFRGTIVQCENSYVLELE
jgi:hypothetical protein